MLSLLTDVLERPLKAGHILQDRYLILCFIAKGSYGMTYRATDLITNHTVVVKQLRKRKYHVGIKLFEREARMLNALDHHSIPKSLNLFEEDARSFLVMECVEGKNVEELIFYEGRKYDEKESFQVLLQVLHVVQYFHDHRIIHRDLRLPNILLKDNHVYVIDFGLAAFCDEEDVCIYENMSFEKRLYREISFSSDFYALGHFVLFLLYSSYQSTTRKNLGWEEELTISSAAKRIIRKLLKLEKCYENANDIMIDVKQLLNIR